jgi:NADPH:quinone reductase-like Zn-dependent oxidoreductase
LEILTGKDIFPLPKGTAHVRWWSGKRATVENSLTFYTTLPSSLSVSKGFSVFNTVAVVGATGAVGRIILQLLQERKFPAKNFRFLASARSAGQKVEFNGSTITVEELTHDCFKGIDLVIASTRTKRLRSSCHRPSKLVARSLTNPASGG